MKHQIVVTVEDDLHDFIMENSGNSKWHRASTIRSFLYMIKNGYIGTSNGIHVPNKRVDDWKTIDQLRKEKKVEIGIPLYKPEVMGDLMSELKKKLKEINKNEELADEIQEARKTIRHAMLHDYPPIPKKNKKKKSKNTYTLSDRTELYL